jgi:glucosamine-6-phosphate deaminase
LSQVPKKYYQPDSALELSGISRFEKMKTHITTTALESSKAVAREIADLIRQKANENKKCVLCLTSGRSPIELFNELVRIHNEENLSFQNVVIFNLFEYYPLDINFAQSCMNQIKTNLLDKVDILPENIYSIDPTLNQSEISQHCINYEHKIEECIHPDDFAEWLDKHITPNINP